MCDTDADTSDVAENPDPEADAAAGVACGGGGDLITPGDEAESDLGGLSDHSEVEGQPRHVDENSNLQTEDQDEAGNHLQVFAPPDVATVHEGPHSDSRDVPAEGDSGLNDQLCLGASAADQRENGENNRERPLSDVPCGASNSAGLGSMAPEDEILEYPIRNNVNPVEDFEPECDQAPVLCDDDDDDCECMNDDDDDEYEDDDDDEEEEEDVEEEEEDSENLLEAPSYQVTIEDESMNVCCSPADMNVREASIVYGESDESEAGVPMPVHRGYESPEFSSLTNAPSQQSHSVYKVSDKPGPSLLGASNPECSSDEIAVINFNQIQTRESRLFVEPVTSSLSEKDSCASHIQATNIDIPRGELPMSHSSESSTQNKTSSVNEDQTTDEIEIGQDVTCLASQNNDTLIIPSSDASSTQYTTVDISKNLSVLNPVTTNQVASTARPDELVCDKSLSTTTTDTSLVSMTSATSPESGIDTDHSRTPGSTTQTPIEDQILSELEAELDTPKPLPPSLSGSPLNGMAKVDLNQFPEFIELQKQLQQANRELAKKENQIKELDAKVLSQADQIEVIKMERNSYRKELDMCQGNDLYLPQIKALENNLVQKDTEIRGMKDRLAAQEVTSKRMMANMQIEHKSQMDQMAKLCEESKREKESMVMKFAEAEHKGLDMQRTTEKLETRLRDALKDKDILLGKLSNLRAERHKIVSRLDGKASEYIALQRELEKQKELVSTIENRTKWTQNKLSAEIESHKETKLLLQSANAKLKESKEECEQIRKDCQDIIKTYQESEEIKSNSLDNQLKAKESELKVQEQEKNDQQEIYSLVVKELESLKVQHKDVLEELKTMKDKVSCLEDECRNKEDTLSKFKDVLQNQKSRIKELRTRLKELEDIKSDYDRGQEELAEMERTLQDQKQTCCDTEADIEACKSRESELLELTSNLSGKNAQLQSDNITVTNKVLSLEESCNSMKIKIQELETKSEKMHNELMEEKRKHQEETTSLAEQLHDKNKAVEELSVQLEEEKDDIRTLKRKHANNIKDLTRQLTHARRKLESYENTGEKDSTSLGSRTSSNGSLNTLDSNVIHRNGNPDQEYPVITEQVEVDKQVLIERIVKLQKSHARKSDKIEFMEDHINHLVNDIQRKKRIIQSYALREEVGVLAPEYMDKNKVVVPSKTDVKAVLSRKGGIMASLYNSQQTDQSMTLDLSLEINSKLQSVLEDTLLKNITLKDSLDTLGKEIARLSQENRQLQLQLQNIK